MDYQKDKIKSAFVEIMIPLVSPDLELKILRDLVNKTAREIEKESKIKLEYMVGTMIELPRAALQARSISKYAELLVAKNNNNMTVKSLIIISIS